MAEKSEPAPGAPQKLQPVRGTQDLLASQCRSFRAIDDSAWGIAQRFGYEEIRTPIFEFGEVFHRTLGETSDVVSKETYKVLGPVAGEESLVLRPEGTAGIARAFISNGLAQELPLKFYYYGPMFRYERPQKGRYRQFHQVGVEFLGVEDALADVECISLGHLILQELELAPKVRLEINSLGDSESRSRHREALVNYLARYESELSEDSKVRLKKNPLRILDSKDEGDRKILTGAPNLKEFLNQSSRDFSEQVLNGLTKLGIPFHWNERLVRGLDYYTHTVFEFTTQELGAQGAVIAGGRYNGLIGMMGGQDTPGVGWAAGVERLALLLGEVAADTSHLIAVVAAEDSAKEECSKIAFDLREKGFTVEQIFGGNMGKKMKRAAKSGAVQTIIVGSDELQKKTATLKNMTTGEQTSVPRIDLADNLSLRLGILKVVNS